MPVSPRRDPLPPRPDISLHVPQARVLAALMPANPTDPPFDWPTLSRTVLAARIGVSTRSDYITRSMNGIRPSNRTTGTPHLGLIALGCVEEEVFDIDGVKEVNYRITATGIHAYERFVAEGGILPPVRDGKSCVNDRYKTKE